tara:strand:- start:1360 stop:1797 length:438 start_codon:yes stop_codon:yes gene_type:complete
MINGFTLIELLVAIAILGIISAIGIVSYTGYIDNAKQQQATTGLSSIALSQEEFRAMNRFYYPIAGNDCADNANDSADINSGLFFGDNVLKTGSEAHYTFCIDTDVNGNTFTAHAYSTETGNADTFSITHTGTKVSNIGGDAGTW